MHSKIFQLSTQELPESEWISVYNLDLEQVPDADYFCRVELGNRDECIQDLNEKLREFFELDSETGCFVYEKSIRGGLLKWCGGLLDSISNIMKDGFVNADHRVAQIRKRIDDFIGYNPSLIVISHQGFTSEPMNSTDFALWVNDNLSVDDKLHVCGIVDFHY